MSKPPPEYAEGDPCPEQDCIGRLGFFPLRCDTCHTEPEPKPEPPMHSHPRISIAAVIAASVIGTAPAIENHPIRRTYGPAAFGVPSFKNRNQRQRRRDHRRIYSHGWKGGRK